MLLYVVLYILYTVLYILYCGLQEWVNIQALLNTIGPMGLYARVLRFDTDNLSPEITARALQIISTTDLKGVRSEGSIGAATFFLWVSSHAYMYINKILYLLAVDTRQELLQSLCVGIGHLSKIFRIA